MGYAKSVFADGVFRGMFRKVDAMRKAVQAKRDPGGGGLFRLINITARKAKVLSHKDSRYAPIASALTLAARAAGGLENEVKNKEWDYAAGMINLIERNLTKAHSLNKNL
jgi:hypothetical protein